MLTALLRCLRPDSARNRPARVRRKGRRSSPAPRRPFVPRLEALEDRTVPSTFLVENLADSGPGSLRQAVLDANSLAGPDRIRFAPAARDGSIVLTSGELVITDDLTIDGPGAHRLTISGNDASRVFHISGSTTDVAIDDLTIANGRATGTTVDSPFGPVTLGGGILNNGGRLTLSHVTMSNNQAVGDGTSGGAIANVFGATLTVGHSAFTDNRAAGTLFGGGGGILNHAGSTLTVEHSTFTGNQATASQGGAAAPLGLGEAGAISNGGGSMAMISHSRFEGNLARGGDGANGGPGQNGGPGGEGAGGALDNTNVSLLAPFVPSTMIIEHSSLTGNLSIGGNGGQGGAGGAGGTGGEARGVIQNISSTLIIAHSTLADNQAMGGNGGEGGAGRNGGAGGASAGGAISNTTADLTPTVRSALQVSHVLFLANQSIGGRGGDGGANGNGGAGGAGNGGALRNFFSDWDVSHSAFVLNQGIGGEGGDRGSGGLLGGTGGVSRGGGIFNVSGAAGTLSRSTLVLNEATGGAGGLGGNGGNGQGGGVFNGPPTPNGPPRLTLLRSLVTLNRAEGGTAGVGGSAGQGQGGGLYLSPGGLACADLVTAIFANDASTSDDDVFGTLCFI